MLTVWMDFWQMQCCGEPFDVGATVKWTLSEVGDPQFLASLVGQEHAETVTHHEDHHGGLPEDTPLTTGEVCSILAIRCRFDRGSGQGKQRYPVAESATATSVRSANGWESAENDARFVGYLIELAPVTEHAGEMRGGESS